MGRLFVGLGRQEHQHVTAFQLGGLFNRTQLTALLCKVQEQFLTQLRVCHLPASETNGNLDLVSTLQELLGLIEADVEIVDADANAELQFFCFHSMLILTGFLLALGLFKSILAVVHDAANGRGSLRCDLHEVQTLVQGDLLCVFDGHDTELGTILINQTDLTVANCLVDLMLYVTDAETPPIKK